jgi:hypothetical protein
MTATTLPAPATRRTDRLLWTVQVVVGLFMIGASAAPKLFGEAYAVQMFTDIGAGQGFRYAIGVIELAGGIGLLVAPLAGVAAAGLVALMIGAVVTQVLVLGTPVNAISATVIGALMAWVAVARRDRTAAFLHGLRGGSADR